MRSNIKASWERTRENEFRLGEAADCESYIPLWCALPSLLIVRYVLFICSHSSLSQHLFNYYGNICDAVSEYVTIKGCQIFITVWDLNMLHLYSLLRQCLCVCMHTCTCACLHVHENDYTYTFLCICINKCSYVQIVLCLS